MTLILTLQVLGLAVRISDDTKFIPSLWSCHQTTLHFPATKVLEIRIYSLERLSSIVKTLRNVNNTVKTLRKNFILLDMGLWFPIK